MVHNSDDLGSTLGLMNHMKQLIYDQCLVVAYLFIHI